MLRLSRLSLFLLPNSRSPEMPNFLVTTDDHPHAARHTVDDVLFKTVMEYDHQAPMPDHFDAPYRTLSFANHSFSSSKIAPVFVLVGTFLFFFTFSYNIGKPVVDAHRELWYAQPELTDEEEDAVLQSIMEDEDEFE